MHNIYPTVTVIGAMGHGIAQTAAQTGSAVLVYDRQPGAAEAAVHAIFIQ